MSTLIKKFISTKIVGLVLGVAFLIIGSTLIIRTNFTGDEPRYTYYAISFFEQYNFHLALEQWQSFMTKQYPANLFESYIHGNGQDIVSSTGVPAHAVLLPIIVSPLIGFLPSIPVGRIISLLMALATLYIVYDFLRINGISKTYSVIATSLGAVSLPFIAYSAVFYPEISLALVFAGGWRILHSQLQWSRLIALIILISIIPFLHLRGLAGFLALAILLIWQIANVNNKLQRVKMLLAALFGWAIITCIYYILSISLYGNIWGAVNTARPIFSIQTVNELLINYRHGLFVYSPLFIFSFVGLIAATSNNVRIGYEGLFFLMLVILASVGPNPGECPNARFMVQAVPALIVGLALWLQRLRQSNIMLHIFFAATLIWTNINSIYYIINPYAFLANRLTCQTCYNILNTVGIGLLYDATAKYTLITPHATLVKDLENFPPSLSLAEIQIKLNATAKLVSIDVFVNDKQCQGHWTTQPIYHLWGIGMIDVDKAGGYVIKNAGARNSDLNMIIGDILTLWIPDNGCLEKGSSLDITLMLNNGIRIITTAKNTTDLTPVINDNSIPVKINYKMISPQANIVKILDNFPTTLPIAEMQIIVQEPEIINAVDIISFGGHSVGHWSSLPIYHLWGIGIIDKTNNNGNINYNVKNPGTRIEKLNLPISDVLTLWIAENGSLEKCFDLNVTITFSGGKVKKYIAQCHPKKQ